MIYAIVVGFWLSYVLESLIQLLNFRFWNCAKNITKAIEILGISENQWMKIAVYQRKKYSFEEASRLIITVAITALVIGQGFPWLETFALIFSDEGNPSLFLMSWWFFLPFYFIMNIVDVIKGRLKETLVEPSTTVKNQSSNLISNLLAFSLNVVLSTLVAAFGSYIIGSYENWPLILVGFFGAVVVFANWLVPLLDMHVINKKHFKTLAEHLPSLLQEVECFVKKNGLEKPNLWIDLRTAATQKIGAQTQGFFHARKILFTQKAIEELSIKEFLVVLAHEIGHESYHHKAWSAFFWMVGMMFVLWMLPYLASPTLVTAFGFTKLTPYIIMLMLIMFFPILYKHIITPLTNYPRRIFEHQADVYATQITQDIKVMSQALKHIYDQNQGLPLLHPWYSLWYSCHPSLVERIRYIHKISRA